MGASQFALVAFPGGLPEFAIDPAQAFDLAVRGDGAQDGVGWRIGLMIAVFAVLADPECAPAQADAVAACQPAIAMLNPRTNARR
jgi:hypothetical protein